MRKLLLSIAMSLVLLGSLSMSADARRWYRGRAYYYSGYGYYYAPGYSYYYPGYGYYYPYGGVGVRVR